MTTIMTNKADIIEPVKTSEIHQESLSLSESQGKRFNQLSPRFTRNIYDTFKGRLRLAILERDFTALKLHQSSLNILDIGAGQGQFALQLASQGHQLTLLEPSKEMLELAESRFLEAQLSATFLHTSVEKLPTLALPQYDLITCHAMIEWLEDPYQLFQLIKSHIKPKGILSLLFYNREGLIYHNLIRGNFRYIARGNFAGEQGGLTPISPIDYHELEQYLNDHKIQILKKSGIRTYYDFMQPEARKRISEEDHLKMELLYSENPDYLSHARYHHWLLQF